MIDTFNINDGSLNNQAFNYNGNTGWQIWNKPPKCNLVNFFLVGGGAGGQQGTTGVEVMQPRARDVVARLPNVHPVAG